MDVKKKHYDREKIVSERGDKGCIPEYQATIIGEEMIDGCGEPVIPVIEIESINEKQHGRDKEEATRKMIGQPRIDSDNIVERKPTINATHCSCGAEFRKGIVLDIFMGSGSTAIVARALNRDWVGIELNPDYIKIAKERLREWPKERVLAKLRGTPEKARLSKISRKGCDGRKLVPNPLI